MKNHISIAECLYDWNLKTINSYWFFIKIWMICKTVFFHWKFIILLPLKCLPIKYNYYLWYIVSSLHCNQIQKVFFWFLANEIRIKSSVTVCQGFILQWESFIQFKVDNSEQGVKYSYFFLYLTAVDVWCTETEQNVFPKQYV